MHPHLRHALARERASAPTERAARERRAGSCRRVGRAVLAAVLATALAACALPAVASASTVGWRTRCGP
jgi:hypothetical protein